MTALNRTFAFAQMNHIAKIIANHLHFDMAGISINFSIYYPNCQSLKASSRPCYRRFRFSDQMHKRIPRPPPPDWLSDDWIAMILGKQFDLVDVLIIVSLPGITGTPAFLTVSRAWACHPWCESPRGAAR
jgi:hypothetical protein